MQRPIQPTGSRGVTRRCVPASVWQSAVTWGALVVLVLLGVLAPRVSRAQTAAAPMSALERASQERQRISSRAWRTDRALTAQPRDNAAGLSEDPQLVALGRRIYVDGLRADGRPVVGERLDGQVRISGAAAACALCHRRSGLGAVEGPNQISPITGRYLFDQDRRAVANMHLRARKSFNARHDPYTLESFAAAVRSGHHVSGRDLDPLMPRYPLDDAEVQALASYLRHLSNEWSPGVTDTHVQLATIVTPDVDPERKRIFLANLNGMVAQKNGNMVHGQRTMSSGAEMVLQTDRLWDMQVWELHGAASTWQAQLDRFYAAKPVFAVASGLGAGEWEPVHRFCEQRAVPCWFPSVAAVPSESLGGAYSLYFSRGVSLEADVLAQRLATAAQGQRDGGRVLQVYADDGVDRSAVTALRRRLASSSVTVQNFRLGDDAAALRVQLAELGPKDSVVFWLAPAQIKALERLPVTAATPFFSASLGGGDKLALTPEWRHAARLIYPYQLPELRKRGLTVFREWLRIRHLPLEDEPLQSEVYFALNYLNDTLVDMLDNVHRDYLIERGENNLSWREAARAEDEARDLSLPKANLIDPGVKPLRDIPVRAMVPRVVPRPMHPAQAAPAAPDLHTDEGAPETNDAPTGVARNSGAPESTNVYPRLSLGQFQRHASKGAYIVRFSGDGARPLSVETNWLIP